MFRRIMAILNRRDWIWLGACTASLAVGLKWGMTTKTPLGGLESGSSKRTGGAAGTAAIGNYHLASDLATMPSNEFVMPTRRALFERLCRDGEQTVGALTSGAGVSQPAVSKHLGLLKQAGLVRDRHEGRQTHYSARPDALAPLVDWTNQMTGFWQGRIDSLEDLLKRMDQ